MAELFLFEISMPTVFIVFYPIESSSGGALQYVGRYEHLRINLHKLNAKAKLAISLITDMET